MIDLDKLEAIARAAIPDHPTAARLRLEDDLPGDVAYLPRISLSARKYITAASPKVVLELIDLLRGVEHGMPVHLAERCTCTCRRVQHSGHGGKCFGCAQRAPDPDHPHLVFVCEKFTETP